VHQKQSPALVALLVPRAGASRVPGTESCLRPWRVCVILDALTGFGVPHEWAEPLARDMLRRAKSILARRQKNVRPKRHRCRTNAPKMPPPRCGRPFSSCCLARVCTARSQNTRTGAPAATVFQICSATTTGHPSQNSYTPLAESMTGRPRHGAYEAARQAEDRVKRRKLNSF
jgi:hypothetical protein